jgi:hypothetical protein
LTLRLSLRDPAGKETDSATVEDGEGASYEAMLILARHTGLDAGSILSVDHAATGPHWEAEPRTCMTVTIGNLQALAGRLEARAAFIAGQHPENAADLMMAARFARHAIKVRWIIHSVAVA